MNRLMSPFSHPLRYLFVDLNAYFASCEQAANPAFFGKPLIVRPSNSEYTSAVAVSYEAKAFGIKSGMKIYEARERCPKLIVRDARHELYVDYHHKIIEAVENVLPIDKVYSVDEMACRLIGDEQTVAGATHLAQKVKQNILKISPALRCSVGVAPSTLLAKLATDMMKPNGLVFLESKDLPAKILHLPLTEISGISRSMEARLRAANIHTMQDFWNTEPRHARRIWNSVVGERLWYGLHGHDIRPQETTRRMIGHSRVLSGELKHPIKAHLVARELLMKAALRLRREGFTTSAFGFQVKLVSGQRYNCESRFHATQDSLLLLQQLEKLWREIITQSKIEKFAKLSLFLFDLNPIEERMGDLFTPTKELMGGEKSKTELLWDKIDLINRKYGKNTLRLASQDKLNLAYLGAKIAFSRVPEKDDFNMMG
jgi:DNA polymerase IV